MQQTEVNEAMEHGILNEINAVGVLVGKMLPVFLPQTTYIEEGCHVLKHNNQIFMVVSPDGRLQNSTSEQNELAIELKCPLPGKKFTTDVHYDIPEKSLKNVINCFTFVIHLKAQLYFKLQMIPN